MVDDAEGATKVAHVRVPGRRKRRRRPPGGPQGGRLHARPVLAQRRGPVLGPGRVSELGSAGVAFDIDRVSVAYGGTVVCAARGGGGARRRRRWPPTWPAATLSSSATSDWVEARRWSSGRDLATATSTRTGRRRDARPARCPSRPRSPGPRRPRRRRPPRCWSRRCPTSGASGARSSSSSTAATRCTPSSAGDGGRRGRPLASFAAGRRADAGGGHPARRGARRRARRSAS